jgi:ribosomal protein S1
MKNILAFFFLSIAVRCFAEDFTTTDGKKFEGVTVTRIEADGIVVTTDSAIAKLFFAKLPEDVQKKYGYDPAKAAQFQQQMQIDAAARRAKGAAAMQAEAAMQAQQIAGVNARRAEAAKAAAKRAEMRGPNSGRIAGKILNKVPGGYIIDAYFFRPGTLRNEQYVAVVEMADEPVKYIGEEIHETVVKTNRAQELFPDTPGKYAPAPVFVKALPPGE